MEHIKYKQISDNLPSNSIKVCGLRCDSPQVITRRRSFQCGLLQSCCEDPYICKYCICFINIYKKYIAV